jgi:hypothetical protein
MAMFFGRVPASEMGPGRTFTHKGLIHGFVPVYIGDPHGEPIIAVRNGWPEWLGDLGLFLWEFSCDVRELMFGGFDDAEPMGFKIRILGEL